MIRSSLGALALIAAASSASAQSAQEKLDARYDRALAAGYKALFLCSAIANAEANGATRTPESVHEWELTGIQAPLDGMVRELSYEIVRRPNGQIAHVAVDWDETMPPRVAAYFTDEGCSGVPIGAPENWSRPERESRPVAEKTVPDPQTYTTDFGADLRDVVDGAFSDRFGGGTRTTASVIYRDGAIVREKYAPGFTAQTPQRTWSVAKSIAATLVGVAVYQEDVSVSDSIGLSFWRGGGTADMRNALTIDHMLRMASGRYSDTPGNRTDPLYWGGSTVDETATNWPMVHPPGTVYRYANNDTLMAIKAIEGWLEYYKPSVFFEKVGMNHTVAETDWRGGYVLSSQVWSTARDLAKLGQLYLDNGVTQSGERVLPENWREYVSAPSGPQPEGRNWGYGAGWWLLNDHEGIPADTFLAAGNRGQYIVVVPSRNIVIVRRGEDPVGSRFDIAAFARDVLAALEK